MSERYDVKTYDSKAYTNSAVIDLEKPNPTKRLKYESVFISTKEGCKIVAGLLNKKEERIKELETENKKLKQELTNCEDECILEEYL